MASPLLLEWERSIPRGGWLEGLDACPVPAPYLPPNDYMYTVSEPGTGRRVEYISALVAGMLTDSKLYSTLA